MILFAKRYYVRPVIQFVLDGYCSAVCNEQDGLKKLVYTRFDWKAINPNHKKKKIECKNSDVLDRQHQLVAGKKNINSKMNKIIANMKFSVVEWWRYALKCRL